MNLWIIQRTFILYFIIFLNCQQGSIKAHMLFHMHFHWINNMKKWEKINTKNARVLLYDSRKFICRINDHFNMLKTFVSILKLFISIQRLSCVHCLENWFVLMMLFATYYYLLFTFISPLEMFFRWQKCIFNSRRMKNGKINNEKRTHTDTQNL